MKKAMLWLRLINCSTLRRNLDLPEAKKVRPSGPTRLTITTKLVGNLVVVLVEIFLSCLPNRRTNAGLARMCGNRDQHLTHVIGVIRLWKLMADLVSVGVDFLQETAWLIGRGRIRRGYRESC